jgi:hypothetical protein
MPKEIAITFWSLIAATVVAFGLVVLVASH